MGKRSPEVCSGKPWGPAAHLSHCRTLHRRLCGQALQPPLQCRLDHLGAGLAPSRLASPGPGGGHGKVLGAKGGQGSGTRQRLQLALGVARHARQLELLHQRAADSAGV